MSSKRIVVVGGGISGLAAGYYLSQARRAGVPVEEYLVEGGPRLGGALQTERIDGCVVETGADSFLTEKQEAIDLCTQLGLRDQLIGSEDHQRRTWILHRGKLTPLPEGFEFLVPTRVWTVARTPLLSLRDKVALVTEFFSRRRPPGGDESVASFVERHFTRGVLENIVDPLLTAVYGGDPKRLSAASVLPRFVEMEQKWGSLVRGARQATRQRKRQQRHSGRKGSSPIFTTLQNGLGSLVTALGAELESDRVLCGRRTTGISATSPSGYQSRFDDGGSLDADAVILALPAYESAQLLQSLDATLAEHLSQIPYSSSMIVALGYEAPTVSGLPSGFGFLVPQKQDRRLLACTFVGQKFRSRVPPDRVLLRCFLGGMRDEGILELSDAEATATVRSELQDILGISAKPVFSCVYRWRKAMAQYTVGHQERLAAIRSRLAAYRGLFLCGNAYEGIGVPDCIRTARIAVEDCLRHLRGQ